MKTYTNKINKMTTENKKWTENKDGPRIFILIYVDNINLKKRRNKFFYLLPIHHLTHQPIQPSTHPTKPF